MRPGAFFHDPRQDRGHGDEGTAAAWVIAILFALLALVSFAIDYSISLPTQPVSPRVLQTPR